MKRCYLTIFAKGFICKFLYAVVQRCFLNKAFLKILQNCQENTCAGTPALECLFNKVAYGRPVTLLKKNSTREVSTECCKIFKSTYFVEHMRGAVLCMAILWYHFCSDWRRISCTVFVLILLRKGPNFQRQILGVVDGKT